MVEVIQRPSSEHTDYGGGQPLVHIHLVERTIHGNHVAVKVWGDMKIAAKEVIFARELKLKTLQVLLLTPEAGWHAPTTVAKLIYHQGELDNYASIDILAVDTNGYEYTAGARVGGITIPVTLPYDGSLWLNFCALGE